ncbi:MAG: hypothetical protein V4629_07500 [Pseudomonadota bacterium]
MVLSVTSMNVLLSHPVELGSDFAAVKHDLFSIESIHQSVSCIINIGCWVQLSSVSKTHLKIAQLFYLNIQSLSPNLIFITARLNVNVNTQISNDEESNYVE